MTGTPSQDDDERIEKRYYAIGEVAELLGVNTSVLRFWETEFQELQPKKSRNGRRLYTLDDIEVLRTIYYLVKVKKYTLEGARDKLRTEGRQAAALRHARATLEEVRAFLVQLRETS